ncbi:NAD binding domain of 6-phosphogluconate dehydrogenase-domain-containing protein [Xylariomycetidae sp. FL0641]|nr:NAD binding domain of 6-phosphogluconate dehydrogenase-domain-containing protein [Xylariomycetidae sp. FL0641]
MPSPKPQISFIGLGAMGFGMATHLLKQGYTVTGFDVYGPTLERFQSAGGQVASTPADAVRDKPFCVCMVATAAQAQAVLLAGDAPAAPALPPGAALLLCSTVPCAYVQGLARQLADLGRGDILLVDAPVSGGSARAAEGALSIMAGGSEGAVAAARPLLAALADPAKLYIVDGGVGAGSNMKMVHQVLAAVQILAASEGMGLAAALGLDLAAAREEIVVRSRGDAWAWMFEHRTPRMLTPGFRPVASALAIIVKDAGIVTAEAGRAGFPVPMTAAAEQVYFAGLARGYGADDDSSLIRLYTEGVVAADAETKATGSDDDQAKKQKLALVKALLKGIYLCAAAEALAFARTCGLDLDQVFALCRSAAGGSRVFEEVGPAIMRLCRGEEAGQDDDVEEGGGSLDEWARRLQEAVAEAQRLRMPLYLGTQALTLMRLALRQHAPEHGDRLPRAMVAKIWGV